MTIGTIRMAKVFSSRHAPSRQEMFSRRLRFVQRHLSFRVSSAQARMDNYVGCRVSLDCGGLGFFQGVIAR